ncbi:MAG: DUF4446 family protein [Candidatus Moranbacteria bacterium]|nr:DUF4446 family protein [Candidatus Moranbacteria bacterium]
MSTTILFYAVSIIVLIILLWVLMIEIRLKRIFAGIKAKNLEEVLVTIGKKLNQIEQKQNEIDKHLTMVDQRLNKSIRNIETLRFNPFVEAGGNQSFAVAFLNDDGNGVILSSLYARDRMSMFAKPIINGKSSFELTEEERSVLEKAKK